MDIKVVSSGLQTTVQDMGRNGWRHMGVPTSGAADKYSLQLANFISNKKPNSPTLECTLTGPILKFLKSLTIVVTGADMKPKINDINLKMNTLYTVKVNDVLSMGNCSTGCRSYVAFSEDIVSDSFLGSKSTYLPAKLGGLAGLSLQSGSFLRTKPCDYDIQTSKNIEIDTISSFSNEWELRVIEGPEFNFIGSDSKKDIYGSSFIVSNDSSRMGSKLEGRRIELLNDEHMISAPVNIGTIQCSKNGMPIILGCDAQTLGGYPRILQIAEIDFPFIGQLRPYDKISFKKISIQEAQNELKLQELIYSFKN